MPNEQEIVDPLSLNLYLYCYGNPIMYEDPTGNAGSKRFIKAARPYLQDQMTITELSAIVAEPDIVMTIPAMVDKNGNVILPESELAMNYPIPAGSVKKIVAASIAKKDASTAAKVVKSSGNISRMTTKQATAAAKELGYQPTNYITKSGEKFIITVKQNNILVKMLKVVMVWGLITVVLGKRQHRQRA